LHAKKANKKMIDKHMCVDNTNNYWGYIIAIFINLAKLV